MAAITQLRHKHSEGRAYYEKKLAEGKTHKEALRSLKRKISDAIFARLQADARQAAAAGAKGQAKDPGGHPGNDSASSAAGSHPAHQLFGQATPGPGTGLRPGTTGTPPKPVSKKTRQPLDTNSKEDSLCAEAFASRPPVCIAPERLFCRSSGWRVLMLRDDGNRG